MKKVLELSWNKSRRLIEKSNLIETVISKDVDLSKLEDILKKKEETINNPNKTISYRKFIFLQFFTFFYLFLPNFTLNFLFFT